MKSRTTARKNKTRTILLLGFEGATALDIKRPGGQSQFSTRLQAQATEGRRLASLLAWLAEHYQESIPGKRWPRGLP